jgi:hypothetical protein
VNAYQEFQTSGNQWPQAVHLMLHEEDQRFPFSPEPKQGRAIPDYLEKQVVSFGAEHDAALNEVRRYFVLPADPASVLTFLSGHRTVRQLLLEAPAYLKASFGPDAVFNLRAPIDESGSQTLYAVAMWPGDLRDVRQALARFDDAWWISHSRQASGYLAFTYELV